LKKKTEVGGQAVIEGVMMKAPRSLAVAVRRPSGEIAIKKDRLNLLSEKSKIFKLPLIRGVIVLLSTLVLGIKALNFSANEALKEETKEGSSDSNKEKKKDIGPFAIAATMVFALGLGFVLFFLLPLVITHLLKIPFTAIHESRFLFNIFDGIIRVIIFLLYIWIISYLPDIKRIFQYHGAEHKSIYAFEAGEDLTVENIKKYSTLHPRCGTSFLFVVMIIAIIIFSILPGNIPLWKNALLRLALVPLIAGISYEFIKFSDKRRQRWPYNYFIKPGLWLQKITTNEPDESQIEVAIVALNEALNLERG